MSKLLSKLAAVSLPLIGPLLLSLPHAGAQTVTPVPTLDLNRFTGTWYEIARYPNKGQKKCIGDVFELITPAFKPTQLLMVNSCKTKSEYPIIRNGTLRRQDKKSVDGRLKLRYTWPFSSKYWVLAMGPDSEWALVGSPNRKNLWVLSKTAKLDPAILQSVRDKATSQGFDTGKLVATPQNPQGTASVPVIESRGANTGAKK